MARQSPQKKRKGWDEVGILSFLLVLELDMSTERMVNFECVKLEISRDFV